MFTVTTFFSAEGCKVKQVLALPSNRGVSRDSLGIHLKCLSAGSGVMLWSFKNDVKTIDKLNSCLIRIH